MRHARRALDLMPIGEVSSSERDTKPAWVPKCFCYVCEMSAEFISTFVQELGGMDYGVWRSRKVQIHEVDSKPSRKIYRIHPPRQTLSMCTRINYTSFPSACSTLRRYPESDFFHHNLALAPAHFFGGRENHQSKAVAVSGEVDISSAAQSALSIGKGN